MLMHVQSVYQQVRYFQVSDHFTFAAQKYLNEIRTYMPPAHADFINALAQGPSIKDYGMFWAHLFRKIQYTRLLVYVTIIHFEIAIKAQR